jgi:hypothetical protein
MRTHRQTRRLDKLAGWLLIAAALVGCDTKPEPTSGGRVIKPEGAHETAIELPAAASSNEKPPATPDQVAALPVAEGLPEAAMPAPSAVDTHSGKAVEARGSARERDKAAATKDPCLRKKGPGERATTRCLDEPRKPLDPYDF